MTGTTFPFASLVRATATLALKRGAISTRLPDMAPLDSNCRSNTPERGSFMFYPAFCSCSRRRFIAMPPAKSMDCGNAPPPWLEAT